MRRRTAIRNISLTTLGASLSPALLSALQSCSPGAMEESGIKPNILSVDQYNLLGELVNIIIPDTDTPGAKVAGVHQYIDLVLAKVREERDAEVIMKGLDKLLDDRFLKKTGEEQFEVLIELEESGDEFFGMLKPMTIWGYYSSEIGATQELKYVHAAGVYRGDVPYDEIGKNYY